MGLIIGISASLRNARFGRGSEKLIEEIRNCKTKEQLLDYLKSETKIRADDFIRVGRKQHLPFDEIYQKLLNLKGDRGLSNSEAALVAGLWGVAQQGTDIEHIGLSRYFLSSGKNRDLDILKSRLLKADGILLSTPVYFGDRSSLSQSFIEYLYSDSKLKEHFKDRLYAGIAVGAKRNGGQETTLIYQLLDMVNLNLLAVGNDSATTAQYGGTGVAGDVGTFTDDLYGINTCIGVGNRIGSVSKLLEKAKNNKLKDNLVIDIWLLQDTHDSKGVQYFINWIREMKIIHQDVTFRLKDFTDSSISRCIACDICPTNIGTSEVYRCIITTKRDLFAANHEELLSADAILLAAYSPQDKTNLKSVYQKFIERTRYIRRDNYAFSNKLVAPFVFSEISARQNLHLRMLTSLIRHHTIIHHPLLGMLHNDEVLNWAHVVEQGHSFIKNAKCILIGKYIEGGRADVLYNPIGYTISNEKIADQELNKKMQETLNKNKKRLEINGKQRITKNTKLIT